MKIAATLSSTGTPSFYLHAADATHGDLGMVEKKDVVIGISKSGNSQEIKDLIPFSKKQWQYPHRNDLPTLNLFLGKQSDHLLYTPVAQEACPTQPSTHHQHHGAIGIGRCAGHEFDGTQRFSIPRFCSNSSFGKFGKKVTPQSH